MKIYDFGGNADGGKWTFRGGNLTWGNSELKTGGNGWSPPGPITHLDNKQNARKIFDYIIMISNLQLDE